MSAKKGSVKRSSASFDRATITRGVAYLRQAGITSRWTAEILSLSNTVQDAIDESLLRIERTLGNCGRVKITIDESISNHTKLTKALGAMFDYSDNSSEDLRIVFDEDGAGRSIEDVANELGLSHWCYCSPNANGTSDSWYIGDEHNHAKVTLDWRFAAHLVHDVLIDICVYHGLQKQAHAQKPGPHTLFFDDPNILKIDATNKAGVTPSYAAFQPSISGYISLAACSRDRSLSSTVALSDVESQRYVDLWKNVVSASGISSFSPIDLLLGQIKNFGKLAGQLPAASIVEWFSGKPRGKYALWVAVKRPSTKALRDGMARAFAYSQYEQNMIRLLHWDEELPLFVNLKSFESPGCCVLLPLHWTGDQ